MADLKLQQTMVSCNHIMCCVLYQLPFDPLCVCVCVCVSVCVCESVCRSIVLKISLC